MIPFHRCVSPSASVFHSLFCSGGRKGRSDRSSPTSPPRPAHCRRDDFPSCIMGLQFPKLLSSRCGQHRVTNDLHSCLEASPGRPLLAPWPASSTAFRLHCLHHMAQPVMASFLAQFILTKPPSFEKRVPLISSDELQPTFLSRPLH